ncbi:type II secretion system F family protein [Parvibaculum sp.]|uniref:type II secretion system F family protein n=1 Tax=Parvibaculum sp. TaxID=2024848 RepID=UPI003C78BF80
MMQFSTLILTIFCLASGASILLMLWRQRQAQDVGLRLSRLVTPSESERESGLARNDWPDVTTLLPQIVKNRLYQAGIEISKDRFLSICIFALCIVTAAAFAFGIMVALLALISVFLITAAIVDYRARKRMDALSDAMLGYFDRVRQLLVVGNSLSVALARATQSSPPIVIEFFQPAIRRIANGAGVAESVNQLARELDLYELRLFGVAIETNLRFGGSLTAILANLIENIRRRAAVMREVRVTTSQIRASAWVLGILPMFVATIVMMQSPEYMRWFIDEPAGRQMLIYCAISQVIGAFMMRKVIRANNY